jgi:hypothetical protein
VLPTDVPADDLKAFWDEAAKLQHLGLAAQFIFNHLCEDDRFSKLIKALNMTAPAIYR